jgi:hypothetical protein
MSHCKKPITSPYIVPGAEARAEQYIWDMIHHSRQELQDEWCNQEPPESLLFSDALDEWDKLACQDEPFGRDGLGVWDDRNPEALDAYYRERYFQIMSEADHHY